MVKAAYTITSRWTDSGGSVLYKQFWIQYFEYDGKRHETEKFFVVIKIDPFNQSLEIVFDADDYPAEVNDDHPSYHIYYRPK